MPEASYTYEYPRPMVTVDAVVVRAQDGRRQVLLIQRGNAPFEGSWALPGGFVEMDETLEAAVARELSEETGLACRTLSQFRTYGDPGRDPRGRSISVAYTARVPWTDIEVKGGDDASDARWFDVDALPALAFDHGRIVSEAMQHLNQEDSS